MSPPEKGDAEWEEAKPMSKGRCHFGTVTFDGKIYLTGGMAQVGEKRWIDNKITVLTSKGKWKHAGELPQPLSAAAAGILDGKLYLAGGSLNGAHPQPAMWVRIAP